MRFIKILVLFVILPFFLFMVCVAVAAKNTSIGYMCSYNCSDLYPSEGRACDPGSSFNLSRCMDQCEDIQLYGGVCRAKFLPEYQ